MGSVAPQEGDIRPPFLGVGEGRGLRPLQPRDLGAPPQTPQLLKKLAKLFLVSPKPERGHKSQRLSENPAAQKRRSRHVPRGHAPGTG